jgi:hypothetical protein
LIRSVKQRRRPAQNHLIAALRAREKFGALLDALDGRQRRPALATTRNNE